MTIYILDQDKTPRPLTNEIRYCFSLARPEGTLPQRLMITFKDIPGLCTTPIFARNHDEATTLCRRLNDRLGLDDNDVEAMTTSTWEQHESGRLTKFNEMYEKYSTRITGDIHNSFWQIIVNEKQPDAAFEELGTSGELILALPTGGYISTGMYPSDKNDKQLSVELNKDIYGLSKEQAGIILLRSMNQVSPAHC